LCIDHSPHMYFGTRGRFKSVQAARAAALLGWAANGLNDRVGGLLFGDADQGMQHFQPTKDRRAIWRLLKEMSNPSRHAQQGVDCLQRALQRADKGSGTGSLIFVIADFNRDIVGLEQALGQLRQKHSLVLIPVDDPADRDIPSIGRVLFRSSEGELLEVDTDDLNSRETYAKHWQTRRDRLQQLTNRLGIALIPIQTDEDVHRSLMIGLARRARFKARL